MANCEKCGREFCDEEVFFIDGEWLCAECAEEAGYARCQDCGEWFKADCGYEYEGEPLCPDCYDEGYMTCEDCGEVIRSDDAVSIYNHRGDWETAVCEDCADRHYYECMDCGRYFSSDDGTIDGNGDFLCTRCYEYNGWYTCYDCDCFTQDAEEGDDGEYYCPNCINDHVSGFTTHIDDPGSYDNGEAVHGYLFKPRAVICSRTNDPDANWTAGCELEVDNRDRSLYERVTPTAQAIKDMTDRVYMKHDGSLSCGFEIVSHPGTLAHHMYEMPWKGICAKALKAGFRSHDAGSCGLHIHVGRAGLGSTEEERNRTIRKTVVLINRYWDEVSRFTRRAEDQLNGWAARNYVEGYRLDREINDWWAEQRIPICNSHDDRYVAINCENEATIEFRIFRGTLKRDTIIASIQLCWNITHYAMTHSWDEIQHGSWLDMAQYKHWNELDAYLALRGLAPACPAAQNTNRSPSFGGPDGING